MVLGGVTYYIKGFKATYLRSERIAHRKPFDGDILHVLYAAFTGEAKAPNVQ